MIASNPDANIDFHYFRPMRDTIFGIRFNGACVINYRTLDVHSSDLLHN